MKRFLALSFFSTAVFLKAQTIGNSPYAAFGIGEVKYDNTLETSSMGGISTAYMWDYYNRFNFGNPAANANMSLANINVEGTNENDMYRSNYDNYKKTKHANFVSNISIAFPISKKVKFGLGFQPYSSKNYDIITRTTLEDGTLQGTLHRGNGNISLVQSALSYNITPEFGLGLRTNFYFGKIYDIVEITNNSAQLINGFENANKVKSFNFTFGGIYQKTFDDDHKLTLGATYTFGNVGTMNASYKNSTYYYSSLNNKIDEKIIASSYNKNKNLIPENFSFGVGYGKNLKWFASTQIDYSKSRTMQFLGSPFTYNNSYRISGGGWMVPNINDFRNYFNRMTYRFGAFYEKGGLYVQAVNQPTGDNINTIGVSAGLSFPYQNTSSTRMSSIDFAVEYGKTGTLKNNLVKQDYINLKVALNFADFWFKKRTYD